MKMRNEPESLLDRIKKDPFHGSRLDLEPYNPNEDGVVLDPNCSPVRPDGVRKLVEGNRTYKFNILNYGDKKSPITGISEDDAG